MRISIYLDSNIFIYAARDSGARGNEARRLLGEISTGNLAATTASLTVDEVLWKLLHMMPRDAAILEGKRLFQMNVRILDVKAEDIKSALALMERYKVLRLRDAIHAAVTLNAGVFTVVSDDPDFDGVREIERRPLTKRFK